MDAKVKAAFVQHVQDLELRAINGNEDAVLSLACMALLVEGWRPSDPDPGGGEVIDFTPWLRRAA